MLKKIIAALVCVIMVLTTVAPENVWAAENNDITMQEQKKEPTYKFESANQYRLREPGARLNTMKDSKGVQQNFTYNGISFASGSTYGGLELGYKCSKATGKDTIFALALYKDNGHGGVTYVTGASGSLSGTTEASFTLRYLTSAFKNQQYIYVILGLIKDQYSSTVSAYQGFKVKNPAYGGKGNVVKGYNAIITNESVDGENIQYTGSFSVNNLVQSQQQQEQLKQEDYKTDVIIPFDSKKQENKLLEDKKRDSDAPLLSYAVGNKKAFNVQNLVNGSYSTINAVLMYSGKKADVWVYNNQITKSQAEAMGKEFDNKINGVVTNNFGSPSDIDHNGKVNILCYDIQDGFSGTSYVAGYFSPTDLYNVSHSNKCEMFYVDTYPTMGTGATKDPSKAYSTLAHEYQHMVNYNENVIKGKKEQMTLWMNEGMSMAAEQIYLGKSLNDRISYYNVSSSIRNGHSLLYWDNNGDTLANYSLSYLFMQYLRIQSGKGNKIFKELMSLPNNNYKDVQTLVQRYINKDMTFSKFMVEFRAALLLKQKSGLRGFKGDSAFNAVKTQLYTGKGISLRSGGAIVKDITNGGVKVPNNKGKNVSYTIINSKSNAKPTIKGASNKTVYVGQKFNAKKGVSATDPEDGKLTSKIKVSGSVNTKKAGNYYITYSVKDSYGNTVSKKVKITVLNKFKTFTVDSVDRKQGSITGKGTYKATVQAYVKGKKIGKSATVNKKGQYKVSIPKQKAGTKIVVKMTKSWYKTTEKTVKVLNTFGTFTLNKVTTKSKKVTGKGLKGATIKVYVNGKKTGKTVKVGGNGKYSVGIPKQKRGKKVEVRMQKSGYRTVTKTTKVKK